MNINKEINNISFFKQNLLQEKIIQNEKIQQTKDKNSDVFEKNNIKNSKKKNIILSLIAVGIISLIAFTKRKNIKSLFNKNDIKLIDKVAENKIKEKAPNIKTEMTSELATQILKNGSSDNSKIIKALEYATEHGIEDKDLPRFYLDSKIDDIAISAMNFLEKQGNKEDALYAISPIYSIDFTSLTERKDLYKKSLKLVQKLADLTNYSEQDRNTIFYRPIKNLLNHSDEEVRKLAQETLDIITPKV